MSFTEGHALVIGIGSYTRAPQLTVEQTARDAERVAEVLKLPEYGAYPEEQVTLLVREEATRERIVAELKRLARATSDESSVLIFYSGHGIYDADGVYYLTTADTELDGRGLVAGGSGISQRELLRLVKRLPAERVFLIFNACHSGAISPAVLSPEDGGGEAIGSLPSPELADALLGTGEGRVIITACRDGQKSYLDPEKQLTVFADVLSRALQGEGIETRKPVIGVFELYETLFEMVERIVRERWKAEQQPELTVSKLVGPMAIAHYRPRRQPAVLGGAPEPARQPAPRRTVDPEESARALERLLGDNADGDD